MGTSVNDNPLDGPIAIIQGILLLIWACWEWGVFQADNEHTLVWGPTTVTTDTAIIRFRHSIDFDVNVNHGTVIQQIKYPIYGFASDIRVKKREINKLNIDEFRAALQSKRIIDGESPKNIVKKDKERLTDEEIGLLEFEERLTPKEDTLSVLKNCIVKSEITWRCDSPWGIRESFVSQQGGTRPFIGMIDGQWVMWPDISGSIYRWKTALLFDRLVKGDDVKFVITVEESNRRERMARDVIFQRLHKATE